MPNARGSAGLRSCWSLCLWRKGQMEIMGLAIIIILVSLGLLFAVQIMLKAPKQQVQRAKESVLAANFLNTMLGTTTDCNQRTMRELLQDCALTGGVTKCGEETSCEHAHSILQQLFDNTFKEWNLEYYFTVSGGAEQIRQLTFGKSCPGEREQKTQPLPVRPGFEITLLLEICR